MFLSLALSNVFLHMVDCGELIANFTQSILDLTELGRKLLVGASRHGCGSKLEGVSQPLSCDSQRVKPVGLAQIGVCQIEELIGQWPDLLVAEIGERGRIAAGVAPGPADFFE